MITLKEFFYLVIFTLLIAIGLKISENKRVAKNEALREKFRNLPCVICANPPKNDPAHILSYATRLKDEEWNMTTLCRMHHTEQHGIGMLTFMDKYSAFKRVLTDKGFEVFNGKLVNERSHS